MLEELAQVLELASAQEKQQIRAYFTAKLALEDLSCRTNGAGAGACDKKAAFLEIFFRLCQVS